MTLDVYGFPLPYLMGRHFLIEQNQLQWSSRWSQSVDRIAGLAISFLNNLKKERETNKRNTKVRYKNEHEMQDIQREVR